MGAIPFASFGVVLADPPWRFDAWSDKGKHRAPEAHYETMPTPEICALAESLNLDWICAPDCALILWCTWPMLSRGDAHEVMRAWGFTPKTGGTWVKLNADDEPAMGTGKIYRGACEPWLLGTRGNPRRKNLSTLNVILEERREHSRKPEQMHNDIEALFDGPYLELFARVPRPGWHGWGHQYGTPLGTKRIVWEPPAPGPLLERMGAA